MNPEKGAVAFLSLTRLLDGNKNPRGVNLLLMREGDSFRQFRLTEAEFQAVRPRLDRIIAKLESAVEKTLTGDNE